MTKAERRFVRRLVIVVSIATMVWVLFAPGWGLIHYRKLQGQVETLSQQIKDLELRNEELRKEIDRLKNDDAYLEELARHKFGLLKENEKVYEVK